MELERENPHWEGGFFYPFARRRRAFDEFYASFRSGSLTAVYGLRRVGKSTLLAQVANEEIRRGVPREDVFHYSFDEEVDDFWEVVRAYERRAGRPVGRRTRVLFDEVQRVPDWKGKLKRLYDTSGARIAITGSNSALLRKGGESLAGRVREFRLGGLVLAESLELQGRAVPDEALQPEAFERAFWEWVRRPFPELALNHALDPTAYVEGVARKVVFEDLPAVFPVDEPALLQRIFSLVRAQPGRMVDYAALASDFGRHRVTVSKYFDYLEYGFLVRRLRNFTRNPLSSERSLKKAYPSLACFARAPEPQVLEAAVAQALDARFFWNERGRYEVDFILEEPLVGVEVKFTDRLSTADFAGLRRFRERFPQARTAMLARRGAEGALPYYVVSDPARLAAAARA